jgi:ADP-heptose:LPS heptosyltransferase
VIRCLKEQQTGVELHYLTKSSFSFMLKNNPYVDHVHEMEREIDEVITALKAEKFDFIIDLHHNLRTWRLKRKLGVRSASFPKLNIQKYLLTRFKRRKMPAIHVVDRYFKAAAPLGVINDEKGLDYFIPDQVLIPAELQEVDRYVAIAIGAQFATKKMPVDQLTQLIQNIPSTVVLLGGPTDVEAGNAIANNCANTINLCGKTSLDTSALVIQKAHQVITHDTGLMHIAAAFHKPIISIWGNTVPSFGMYPYLPKEPELFSIHEVELSCRPCSKIGHQACPKGHFNCMKSQNLSEIIEQIKV